MSRHGRQRWRAAILAPVLALCVLGSLAPTAGAGGSRPSNLGVTGDEFSLVFSRPVVKPGPSLVQFQNAGEDEHDLVWKRVPGDHPKRAIGPVAPGEVSERTPTRFRAGAQYRFWCTLADHRERGMRATLRVRR
ncbi:hypothetical protein HJD18_05500 [Thermoleophilia bacterium SCSIO 60948]|nr:hypothetical protein HJD18_05500 [Thermoleophilia bacterium SCSIO 60948]